MAIASDQDRKFLSSRGFVVVGSTFANFTLGRFINPVYVNPFDLAAAVVDGAPGSVIMWHAARQLRTVDDDTSVVLVGGLCDTPTTCYVQAELANWVRR